jgi:hypothetical protein
MATPSEGFEKLLGILDKMEIPYSVGGSVASSVHGIPRLTMDVDLVVDLRADQVNELVSLLQADFYADAPAIKMALARGRASNVIHLGSAYKFDLFPLRRDDFSGTEFGRRKFTEIRTLAPDHPIECAVASAEDTILRKLEWYRAGGETSERQWNDLRGILKVSGARLELDYLRKWAPYLKVEDLLERLLAERL